MLISPLAHAEHKESATDISYTCSNTITSISTRASTLYGFHVSTVNYLTQLSIEITFLTELIFTFQF